MTIAGPGGHKTTTSVTLRKQANQNGLESTKRGQFYENMSEGIYLTNNSALEFHKA